MGYVSSPYTLDTTYLVLLPNSREVRKYPDNPDLWEWQFESGEHDSVTSVYDFLAHAFGGWFAEPGRHQIVEASRRVMDPKEYQ